MAARRGKGRAQIRGRRAGFGALTSIAVALSLLVQLVLIPYHQALSAPAPVPSDPGRIEAQLKAVFGDAAALCVQVDDKGAPTAPAGHCDDDCPLCRFAAEAAALVTPDLPALPARLDANSRSLGATPEPGAVPSPPLNRQRARAPPFPV